MEVWKQIPDFPHYEASNLGRVRFVGRQQVVSDKLGRNYVRTHKPRIRKASTVPGHYAATTLYNNGIRKHMEVHRIITLTFLGKCPPGLEVRHLDGNKLNNRLANLCYGTRRENIADVARHGRRRRGETAPSAKLTQKQVDAIRGAAARGVVQRRLAEKYGVGAMTISRIVRHQRWSSM